MDKGTSILLVITCIFSFIILACNKSRTIDLDTDQPCSRDFWIPDSSARFYDIPFHVYDSCTSINNETVYTYHCDPILNAVIGSNIKTELFSFRSGYIKEVDSVVSIFIDGQQDTVWYPLFDYRMDIGDTLRFAKPFNPDKRIYWNKYHFSVLSKSELSSQIVQYNSYHGLLPGDCSPGILFMESSLKGGINYIKISKYYLDSLAKSVESVAVEYGKQI